MGQLATWLGYVHLSPFDRQVAGYIAAAMVLGTFCMQEMRWLRATAIGSNLAFIFYAAVAHLQPILVLHVILLPVNSFRLAQILMARRVGRRLLGRQGPESDLARPAFLSHGALADPATALLLAEREQQRVACLLPARLPHEGAASTGMTSGPSGAAIVRLLGEIDQYLAATASAVPTMEQLTRLAGLHSRNELLRALHETLGELDEAVRAAPANGPAEVGGMIVQGLGTLLLCVEDAARSHDPADIDVVLRMTADRSRMVDGIRGRWFAQQSDSGATGYRALYTITALYERTVWLLRRYCLLLRDGTAPSSDPKPEQSAKEALAVDAQG
jgi:hypothetical protein